MKKRKISALFSDEIKTLLFASSFAVICMELFSIFYGGYFAIPKDPFIFSIMGFFLFYSILENLFKIFVGKKASALITIFPATLMFVLLDNSITWPYIKYAVALAVILRLVIVSLPCKKMVLDYGCFFFDVIALYLCFAMGRFRSGAIADKLLFTFLIVLTMSAFQRAFPFIFFSFIGIIVAFLPMSKKPIDWTFLIKMGEQVAQKAEDISYYLPYHIGGSAYNVGYSSFNVKGDKINKSLKNDRAQLVLTMTEKPYFTYKDEASGEVIKMRRSMYLSGGNGIDKERFIRFINFLHANGVTQNEARLFSQISKVDIEYKYIRTKDEIAPSNSLALEAMGKRIEDGVSKKIHKKGYSISARYLDIDYGSPYLISCMMTAGALGNKDMLSFDEAVRYANELYSFDLTSMVSEEEYNAVLSKSVETEYLETDGASERLAELAKELTRDAKDDYDKCKNIERYLRQYKYSLDASGGHKESSDMSTSEGMTDIADRFLFETQSGYCVHYASSMVMLLRLAGIPARAEMGFYYTFPFEKQVGYKISGACAHTWPVAYIEGVGWVPFEPTGAYHTFDDYTWHRASGSTEKANTAQHAMAAPKPDNSLKDNGADTIDKEKENSKMTAEAIKVAWPVAISIAVIFIVIITVNLVVRILHYKYGDPEERLRLDVEQIKKVISSRCREKFEDRGILSDYVSRAPDEYKDDLKVVFDAYYRSIYGNEENKKVQEEENELAKSIREELCKKKQVTSLL